MWLWEGSLSLKQPCPPSLPSFLKCHTDLEVRVDPEALSSAGSSLRSVPTRHLQFLFSLFLFLSVTFLFVLLNQKFIHMFQKSNHRKAYSEITTLINFLCIFSNFST